MGSDISNPMVIQAHRLGYMNMLKELKISHYLIPGIYVRGESGESGAGELRLFHFSMIMTAEAQDNVRREGYRCIDSFKVNDW